MNDEISYDEAGQATDVETLIEYCKQGALENNTTNDQTLDGWRDGWHLIESYLDHNKAATREVLEQVSACLSAWLCSQLSTATAIDSRQLGIDDARVVIRKEPAPSERYYWASPVDGSPVGSREDAYCRFLTREQAIREAQWLAYTVVAD